METEESALCALHSRVHQLDKVLIATAFFVRILHKCSALFEMWKGRFFFTFNISYPYCAASVELVSERLHGIAVRGLVHRKTEICSFISSYTHFYSKSQKRMNDLLDISVHFSWHTWFCQLYTEEGVEANTHINDFKHALIQMCTYWCKCHFKLQRHVPQWANTPTCGSMNHTNMWTHFADESQLWVVVHRGSNDLCYIDSLWKKEKFMNK